MQNLTKQLKIIVIKTIGFLTLNLYLIPISRKYPKIHVPINKLNSILTISEIDKKGGAAKVGYIIHKSLLKERLDTNILVNMVTEPENNIIVLKQRNDRLARLLNIYSERYQWFDFFKLASFNILEIDEFKRADIVHMHNIHLNYFSKFVLPKLTAQKRTIWTLHDSLDLFEDYPDKESDTGEIDFYKQLSQKQRRNLRRSSERIVNNSYLTIVTPSRWLYNKAKKGIFKNTDIRLIHNGVDEKIFKPYNKIEVRKELNLPVNKILLLFSAAWGLTAGTKDSGNTILKMYEHLKNNDDVVFIILGGAEKDFNDEKSIVIPYISDQILLAKYYSAADLFIYPSLWDNLPLAVIENMATGTPVLTYNTGGIPELVKHMGTGYIAKYNDTQDFMKGLDLFISDVNLRDSASERSIQIFLQDFTQTKMVNDYFSLYNELIQK